MSVETLTDANGNEINVESVDQDGNAELGTNYTKVTISGSTGEDYTSTVSFNSIMSTLTKTDGAGNSVDTYVYGDANNPYSPTTVTDANGKVWTYSYTTNGYGNPASEVTPRGTTTTYSWSFGNFGLGEVAQQQDSYMSGGTITYKAPTLYTYYEPSGLYATIIKPTPDTTESSAEVKYSYTYDALGDLTQTTTPGNDATSTITDTLNYGPSPQIGRILSATDNLGHITYFTYDDQGNMTSRTDALGNTTYWGRTSGIDGYNIANQNVLITYPATGQTGTGNSTDVTAYLYPGGPKTSETNYNESGAQYRQTSYGFGAEGELSNVTGSTEPVSYTYDELYRVNSLTDGKGNTTSYYYNRQGYLDSTTYPGYTGPTPVFNSTTGTWSNVAGADSVRNSSYDADGDVLTRVDGRGVTTTYAYSDPENKLTGVSYNVGSTGVPLQPNVSLIYDGFGRLASVDNGVTKEQYGFSSGGTVYPGYDDDDNLLNVQTGYYVGGSISFSANVSYRYYPDGSEAVKTVPSGNFTYLHDAAGRITGMTNPAGEYSSWTYSNNNWLSTQALGDGAATAYTYNPRGLITQILNKDSSGNVTSNFNEMAYDSVGNRTSLAAGETSYSNYSGSNYFSYDNRNELSEETSTRNGGFTHSFAYDAAENPTEYRSTTGNTYYVDNQRSNTGYAFDGNGNPTTYKGSSLGFDVENRLVSDATSLTAGYDGEGKRAWKTDSTGTTYYLYDKDGTISGL